MRERIQAVAAAATSGNAAALDSFKAQGVSLGVAGRAAVEPVVEAMRKGKVEEAKVMWSALSNLGAELDCVDGKGRTALWMEAEKGEVEVVRELHRMGASVETLSELGFDGTTPHRSHYSPQLKTHQAPVSLPLSPLPPPPEYRRRRHPADLRRGEGGQDGGRTSAP